MVTARIVPSFRLPDGRGGTVGSEDHLQQRDMLVAILHPSCAACRAAQGALARRGAEVRARGAAVLAVMIGPPPAAAPPAPALPCGFDATGQVAALLALRLELPPGEARVVPADRFGRVYATLPVHGRPAEDVAADALDWLDFVQWQCPECGAPEW